MMRAVLRVAWFGLHGERLFATGVPVVIGLFMAFSAAQLPLALLSSLACGGALVGLARLQPRELGRLPLSRRQIWLSWFVFGGGGPVAIAVIAELLAWALQAIRPAPPTMSLSTVTLSVALVGATAMLALAALASVLVLGIGAGKSGLRTGAVVALFVLPLLGPFIAIWMRARLPLTWHDAGPVTMTFLIAGAIAGIVAWRFTPHTLLPTRTSETTPARPSLTPGSAPGIEELWAGGGGRWGLLRYELLMSMGLAASMAALFAVSGFFQDAVGDSTSTFLPLAALLNDRTVVARGRRLRTLPIAMAFIARLYTARPLLWWLTILVLRTLAGLRYPEVRPTLAHLPVDLGVVAMVVTARSVSLRWGPRSTSMFDFTALGVLFVTMIGWRFVEKWSMSAAINSAEAGLLAVAVIMLAALLDQRTMVARSELYRAKPTTAIA